ncbi:hypothetical protein SDC9_71417 [bioreactor metagenome]|uniref:Uncharacterized protein n=1 Tax=bioreactor metagenome TaxID=1076179 RepID=A0A644YAI0_9ZZZZ
MVHLGYHSPGLGRVGRAVLEILAHAVFKPFGFPHINDLAGSVHHQIDARLQRQIVGFLPQLLLRHV